MFSENASDNHFGFFNREIQDLKINGYESNIEWNHRRGELPDFLESIDEAKEYKYLISDDDDAELWERPEWIMSSGAVLFKTVGQSNEWYHSSLIPWLNYIPIKPDLSDLEAKIQWA